MKVTMVDCTKDNSSFDEWFSRFQTYFELQGATDEALNSLDKEAYRGYYNDGYNVEEAYKEECEYSE